MDTKKSKLSKAGRYVRELSVVVIAAIILAGCSEKKRTLETFYLKEGKLCSEIIPLDFLDKEGNFRSKYIDSLTCTRLDSVVFVDNSPDRMTVYSTPVPLDFSKNIEPYSPEYYCVYVARHIIKDIEYYGELFDGKINFDIYDGYRNIEVCIGDLPEITSPKTYILREKSNPSPSLFYHEIGHRAFWFLQDSVVNFRNLSITHLGLLEYFTVSLNDSPVVGEDFLGGKMVRDADCLHKFPPDGTYKLGYSLRLMEDAYPVEMQNSRSSIYRLITAYRESYGDMSDVYDDNHRGGMVLTSTLWRIRKVLGQQNTDKLVAQTVWDLNRYMDKRPDFYSAEHLSELHKGIDWCDVFYGLIQKDRELFGGKNTQTVVSEFEKTGYPVDLVKY